MDTYVLTGYTESGNSLGSLKPDFNSDFCGFYGGCSLYRVFCILQVGFLPGIYILHMLVSYKLIESVSLQSTLRSE